MAIIANAAVCTGCRMCELACSFHHRGTFSPEASSIRTTRDNLNGEISVTFTSSCDSCESEARPFCIKYCVYGALKEG